MSQRFTPPPGTACTRRYGSRSSSRAISGGTSLCCDVVVVFLAWNGHNRGSGLFLDSGGRGVRLGRAIISGKADTLVADHLHMEETEVMDVLRIPSGEPNFPSAEIVKSPSNGLQNRYSLPVFILWQQIGEHLLRHHQGALRSLLTRVQPSNG